MEPTVLVIEDDPLVLEILEVNLTLDGWRVVTIDSGAESLELLQKVLPDVVVLDVRLPSVNGFEICRQIRSLSDQRFRNIPILMLTALAMQTDKLAGFTSGADDYLTKPFDPCELNARLRALLRRSGETEKTPQPIVIGPLELNPLTREVMCSGNPVQLKPQEFDLLYALAREPGRIFSRERLLKDVWHYSAAVDSRTVDMHISYLRRKLDKAAPGAHQLLVTVHGTGYKLEGRS